MKPWEKEHDEDPHQEGGMAVSNMKRSQEMLADLLSVVGPTDRLPGWVQSKFTEIFEDLSDVHGYIMGLAEEGIAEGKKKGLWANIHARRKAGKRPKRRGEKGYPKTLKIEGAEDLKRFIALVLSSKGE